MIQIVDYIFNKEEVRYFEKRTNHVYKMRDTYVIRVNFKDKDWKEIDFGEDKDLRDIMFDRIIKGDENGN